MKCGGSSAFFLVSIQQFLIAKHFSLWRFFWTFGTHGANSSKLMEDKRCNCHHYYKSFRGQFSWTPSNNLLTSDFGTRKSEKIANMRLIVVAATISLCIGHSRAQAPQPGAQWSEDEITNTRERIWKIIKDPNTFVGDMNKTPIPDKVCNSACWTGKIKYCRSYINSF